MESLGPTMVMTPRRMFHSWGSLSRLVERKYRPTGPSRSSCSMFHRPCDSVSSIGRIEGNFSA